MRKTLRSIVTVILLLIVILNTVPMHVNAVGGTLTVQPSVLIEAVSSGTSRSFSVAVNTDFALDIVIGGLGETPSGAITITAQADDKSPFTARPWISIDKTHLEAGNNQTLTIFVQVPSGAVPGEKYAAIYLYSKPDNAGHTAVISGIVIPLIIVVDEPSFTPVLTGQITDLKLSETYKGVPVEINTYFNNTGNARIANTTNRVIIRDNAGNTKWQNNFTVAAPSLIPMYPRIISTKCNAGLDLGSYTVTSDIILTNGTTYSRTASFTVVDPPPIPNAPILKAPGNNKQPGPVIDSLTPTFSWDAGDQVDYYELIITRAPYTARDAVFYSEQLTESSFRLPSEILFGGQKYAWQMTATNYSGTSDASTFYFQTSGSPPIPSATSVPTSLPEKPIREYHLTGIADEDLIIKSFANEDQPYLDAVKLADMEIEVLNPTGMGTLVAGKYLSEPTHVVPLSNSITQGGLGKSAIKHVGLLIDGYKRNTARVTLHFTDAEIAGLEPTSLFLAYYFKEKWRIFDRIEISIEEGTISGEIPVSRLTGGVVICLGGDILNETVAAFPVYTEKTESGISWSLVGIVVVPLFIIGIAILLVERNRRKRPADYKIT